MIATETRPICAAGAVARKLPRRVSTPLLSVIIVNYRRWKATERLVRQLRRSPCVRDGTVEVVIVDNRSPRHPLIGKLRRRSEVSLRRWNRNAGYARAVNEGCRLSRGDWFLLLNPDVSMGPGFIDGVLALAEELAADKPRAGIVGFQLRHSDGSLQLSCGRFPSLASTLLGLASKRAQRKCHRVSLTKRSRVSWVTGCCLLVKKACVEQLDGFDEDYFLYYEDVDFCRRARARGWTIWHEPALTATHHRPLHTRSVPTHLRLATRHALLTYAAKHWTGWQFRLLTGIVHAEAWVRQRWALWRGSQRKAHEFAELREMVAELHAGRRRAARRRLDACVRRWERHVARRPRVQRETLCQLSSD